VRKIEINIKLIDKVFATKRDFFYCQTIEDDWKMKLRMILKNYNWKIQIK
jgi:hypothetical protein